MILKRCVGDACAGLYNKRHAASLLGAKQVAKSPRGSD